MSKPYFHKVAKGDEVYGLVFGHGVVKNVWENSHYTFEVEFDNGYAVPYTTEGYPAWGMLDTQTVYYKSDIDLVSLDFAPTDKILSVKKIIKLKLKGKLEVRCPSGLWQPSNKCPQYITEEYLESGKLHLFRKSQKD